MYIHFFTQTNANLTENLNLLINPCPFHPNPHTPANKKKKEKTEEKKVCGEWGGVNDLNY